MALISCEECGKEVSDKADSCPHCGLPIKSIGLNAKTTTHANVTRTGAKWEGIGFILIAVGMITAMATGEENNVGGILVVLGFVIFIIGRFK